MTQSYVLKKMMCVTTVAMLLAGVPSHATIITSSPDRLSGFSWSTDVSDGNGMLSDADLTLRSGSDSRWLSAFLTLATAPALSSDGLPLPGFASNAGGLVPGDASDAEIVEISLAAVSDLMGQQWCAMGNILCAGGGVGTKPGDPNGVFALMPPGAGGRPTNAAPGGSAHTAGSVANEVTRSGRSNQVPQPVLLALLALGLVGIGTGIRKYIA